MCATCDPYDTEIEISSAAALGRVLRKIRSAVDCGQLNYNRFESDRAFIGQTSFLQLNPDGPYPDVMRYYFGCSNCGNVFGLMVETYHGSGGTWSKLGTMDA